MLPLTREDERVQEKWRLTFKRPLMLSSWVPMAHIQSFSSLTFPLQNNHSLFPGSCLDSGFPNKCTFITFIFSSYHQQLCFICICGLSCSPQDFLIVTEYSLDIYAEMHSKLRLFWSESIHIHECWVVNMNWMLSTLSSALLVVFLSSIQVTWGWLLNYQLKDSIWM